MAWKKTRGVVMKGRQGAANVNMETTRGSWVVADRNGSPMVLFYAPSRWLKALNLLNLLYIVVLISLPGVARAQTHQQLHGYIPAIVPSLTPMGRLADSTPIDL